jgi:hypothetical protein
MRTEEDKMQEYFNISSVLDLLSDPLPRLLVSHRNPNMIKEKHAKYSVRYVTP